MASALEASVADFRPAARESPGAGPALGETLVGAVFEEHPDALLVVGPDGALRAANRSGRELIARSESLSAPGGLVVTSSAACTLLLRQRVARALEEQREAPTLHVPRVGGGTLAIRSAPLGPRLPLALLIAREHAALALHRFGFTPAERLVSERLAHGATVSEIALQLGISVETVRCHLKQAFVKARVHRQAELVSVLLGG